MRIKVTSSVAFLIPFIDYFVWGPLKVYILHVSLDVCYER